MGSPSSGSPGSPLLRPPLASTRRPAYNRNRNIIAGGLSHGIPHRAGNCGKMEDLAPDGPAVLHRRPHPRRAEVRHGLGHPRGRGKAPGPPACPETGGGPRLRPAGPHQPHAPDEHPLPAGPVFGGGGGHGGRPPAGHRPGGVLLLHRPAGTGGAGGGGLSHQPGHGSAPVRLPDLRLCQPLPPPDPARPVRPGRDAEIFGRRSGEDPPPAGGGGVCGGHLRRAAPPAAAGGAAGGRGPSAPAAHRAAGLCPVCAGPLSLSEGGSTPTVPGSWRPPSPWARPATPSPPSTCT